MEMEGGEGSQEQVGKGLEAWGVLAADDRIEKVIKMQALQVSIHPGMRGTGGDRQAEAQAAGRVQVICNARHGRQGSLPIQTGAVCLRVQGLAVERRSD